MIHVVEFPHQGRPHAWFAFDRDDFVRKVCAGHGAEPGSTFDACVARLRQDLKACRVFMDDDAAVMALLHDPLLDPKDGFYGHMALREQLIALEAIEEEI